MSCMDDARAHGRTARIGWLGALLGALVAGCAAPAAPAGSGLEPSASSSSSPLSRVAGLVKGDRALASRLAPSARGFAASGDRLESIAARARREGPLPSLATRVGARAGDAWELSLEGSSAPDLRLIPEDHAAVEGTLDQGRVLFRDVRPSTDAVLAAGESWTELVWLLRDARAPSRFALRLAPSQGALAPRAEADGGVSFVDGRGAARLAMAAPFAIDAGGTRRGARVSLEGDRLIVDLDTRGLAYPIVLDPYVGTARWSRVAVDPPGRGEAKMAALGGKLVLVGGAASTTTLDDTWEYDGVAWARRTSATTPLPRSYFSLGSLGARVILFGGQDASGALLDDTWAWDGTAWSKLAPAHKPPARRWAASATVGSKLLLFSGVGSSAALSDTWEFDGADWTERATAVHPPGSALVRMAGVGATAVAVIGNATWTWDGAAWTDRTAGAPVAFSSPQLAVAGGKVRAVDFGAPGGLIVWEWSGSAWSPQGLATEPPGRRAPAIASLGGDLLLFGGYTGSGYATLDDLWSFGGGSAFVQVVPKSAPSPRLFPAGATLDDRFVVFGGLTDDGALDDTWEWDGARWRDLTPATRPSTRFGAAFADAGSTALLYGGNFGGLDDVWTWDHARWTQIAASSGLVPLGAPTLTRIGGVDVLVDGPGGGAFGGAWTWNGSAFVAVPGSAAPMGAGVLGAYGGHGLFVDLSFGAQWKWEPTGFIADATANAADLPWRGRDLDPISIDGAHAVEVDRFLLAMIDTAKSGAGLRNEAWLWDGARWSALATTGLPLRTSYALGRRGASVVLFGGADDAFEGAGDTYVLSLSLAGGTACKADAECDTGRCADGVCCNRACAGTCEACDLPGTAGTCTPVVGAPKHGACGAAGADPCSQALCDGKSGTACKAYVGSTVSCRAASCADGGDVAAASCNGSGTCPAAVTHKCAPFACGATACKDACRVDDDCEGGFHCEPSSGRCLQGAVCVDDRTLTGADGTKQACAPYRCAAAACLSSCSSSDDCLGGYACDVATRACLPAGDGGGTSDGGGCGASGAVTPLGGWLAGLALVAAGLGRRARRLA